MEDMHDQKRLNVCFIIPDKAEDTATHFAHKYELLEELKDRVRFFTYQPTFFGIVHIKMAYFFYGCRIFYVHYSFKGALIAIILTTLFGGKVFYWNCGMPWLYKRFWFEEYLFRFILQNSLFVTGTQHLADEYARCYRLDKKNIRVMPNAIRIARFQKITKESARMELNLPQDKKIILFLHHLSHRKGAHLLPDIIKEFKNREDVLFVIVGDGPEKKNLESRIQNLSINNVRLEGSVSNKHVPFYMAAADIFLMPSEEEGMPNALLEAMVAGVPFVASDVGGVREMTPKEMQEFILPYGAVNKFTGKLQTLVDDEEKRKHISIIERSWAEQFDVSRVRDQFLQLLGE